MPADTYELIAQGMRYWFTALGMVIAIRVFRWLLHENRQHRKILHKLPDAGLIGEIVDLYTGESHSLPREGLIGSSRVCDVRIPGLRSRHIEFTFTRHKGIRLVLLSKRLQADLDGLPLQHSDAYALHGSVLTIGEHPLRFRLFEGLDIPVWQHEEAADISVMPGYELADPFVQAAMAYQDSEQMPYIPPDMSSAADMEMHQTADIEYDSSLQVTWPYAVPPPEVFDSLPQEKSLEENVPYSVRLSRTERRRMKRDRNAR